MLVLMTDLYEEIQTLATKLARKYKDLDPDLILVNLYNILGEYGDISVGSWNTEILPGGDIYGIFYNKILELPEKIIKGNGTEELILKNHIMMQIFRIPCDVEPTLYHLLSLAVYCGILSQIAKPSDFPEGIIKTFHTLKVNSLNNFVAKDKYTDAITTLPASISSDTVKKLLCGTRLA